MIFFSMTISSLLMLTISPMNSWRTLILKAPHKSFTINLKGYWTFVNMTSLYRICLSFSFFSWTFARIIFKSPCKKPKKWELRFVVILVILLNGYSIACPFFHFLLPGPFITQTVRQSLKYPLDGANVSYECNLYSSWWFKWQSPKIFCFLKM